MKPLHKLSYAEFIKDILKTTLEPAQKVFAATAFDGKDPSSYLKPSNRSLAAQLFGDLRSIPKQARATVAMVKGARTGGSMMCSYRLLHLALTLPLTGLAMGEEASGLIVGPDQRLGRQCLRYVVGALESAPALVGLIVSQTSDSVTFKRRDGRTVTIEVLPATRGGTSLRGRSLIGCIFTEAAFFRDSDFQVNDEDCYKSVVPRNTLGGQIMLESTPWIESGLLYSLYNNNFGAPATALVALCPTELMRPKAMGAIVESERLRDPENAAQEFDCKWLTVGSGQFFDPSAIKQSTDDKIFLPLPKSPGARCFAGFDSGFVRDCSALVIVEVLNGVHRVAFVEELRPTKGRPLVPSEVAARFGTVALQYGCHVIRSDSHYLESHKENFLKLGIGIAALPAGQDGKETVYGFARTAMNSGAVRFPDHPRFISQLRTVTSTPTSGGGVAIKSPRVAGGHGDIASAWVAAMWQAKKGTDAPPATYRPALYQVPKGEHGDDMKIGDLDGGLDPNIYRTPRSTAGAPKRMTQEELRAAYADGTLKASVTQRELNEFITMMQDADARSRNEAQQRQAVTIGGVPSWAKGADLSGQGPGEGGPALIASAHPVPGWHSDAPKIHAQAITCKEDLDRGYGASDDNLREWMLKMFEQHAFTGKY